LSLPDQLLVRDLLRLRVRCSQGLDQGAGVMAWMHPPVHRLLGWVSRPSLFTDRRLVWRLNQLRDLGELELLVQGEPAETDSDTVQQLPTLFAAALLDRQQQPIGSLVDAAVDRKTGQILHYLVSRSDPRLPGSSRWRLTTDRIVDQRPGLVFTNLLSLDDLPLARASVRQQLLSRSRRWREQVQEAGTNFEQRLEGWLEEPPWDGINPPDRSSGQFDPQDEPWDRPWQRRQATATADQSAMADHRETAEPNDWPEHNDWPEPNDWPESNDWDEARERAAGMERQRPDDRQPEADEARESDRRRSPLKRRSPLPPRQSRSREPLPREPRPRESPANQSAPDPGDDANDPWI
jgi:hypothetical protein